MGRALAGRGLAGMPGFGPAWKEAPTVGLEEDPSVTLMGAVGGLSITVLEDGLTGHLKVSLKVSLVVDLSAGLKVGLRVGLTLDLTVSPSVSLSVDLV